MSATVEALRGSPLLAGLPDEALERVGAKGEEVDLPAGAPLMAEGSAPDAMYVVLDGELEAHKRAGYADVVVGAVGPGELVGELGLLHGRPRSVGLRARASSRLVRIPADALDDLLGHPRSARMLLATATRRLEHQELLLQQHGRMAALGNLTAGLLHELNNPAAAVRRAVARLPEAAAALAEAERALTQHAPAADGAQDAPGEALAPLVASTQEPPADPIARADAEEAWRARLEALGETAAWSVAGPLAAGGVDPEAFERVVAGWPGPAAQAAARWVAARLGLDRLLEEAGAGAERIGETVAAVKAYSHHAEAPVQDVDLHDGIQSALTLLRHKVPAGVEVRRAFAAGLPRVEGYPGDLNVVWTNLIDNALDAVGATGTVEVATRLERDHVVVEVTDDGPGIPADVAERVFDPFFTTKPVGEGTGLGLATSQAIVAQRHRGHISVESAPGRTTMTVRLPRRDAEAPSTGHPAPSGTTHAG